MSDPTESVRREMIREHNSMCREDIAAKYNSNVYDTEELQAEFEVLSFLAPFVFVKEKATGRKGTLKFQHMPRYYWGFVPA